MRRPPKGFAEVTLVADPARGDAPSPLDPEARALDDQHSRSQSWVVRRAWPLALFGAVVLSAFAYGLFWGPLVHHGSYWSVSGDLWGTFRSAHYVAWGDIGDVYAPGTGLVTLPGISVVLAPVAFITYHLGLSEAFPYPVAHPTAWLLLGPVEVALGALVLFPLDDLAALLGVVRRRRIVLCALEAVLVWPVVAIWGHPEDALAMTFALVGLMAALRGRWRSCGWWWGLALVMQPLVVLGVPIVFAIAPTRRWLRLGLRLALPACALVAIPLFQEWANTTRALFQQPNYPTIDHPTPWLALAPVLQRTHRVVYPRFGHGVIDGRSIFTSQIVHSIAGEVVAAGPGRAISIALSVLIGVWSFRHRPSVPQIVWLIALALSLRCVFESVMNPYYLWPPLAVLLILSARDWRRLLISAATAAIMTVWSYRHTGPWSWWLPIVILLGVSLANAFPGGRVVTAEALTGISTEGIDARTGGNVDRNFNEVVASL
jgi:hypothetical protein